jgi:hypothetical protein
MMRTTTLTLAAVATLGAAALVPDAASAAGFGNQLRGASSRFLAPRSFGSQFRGAATRFTQPRSFGSQFRGTGAVQIQAQALRSIQQSLAQRLAGRFKTAGTGGGMGGFHPGGFHPGFHPYHPGWWCRVHGCGGYTGGGYAVAGYSATPTYLSGSAQPSYPPAPSYTPAPAPAQASCLSKTYMADGTALFTDTCTGETAMTTPLQIQGNPQSGG